jgi:DNA-directed RNA polymerase specialized sigma24 family protein
MPDIPQADPSGASDERLQVRAALQTVPVRQRAVLVLRFFLGMSAEEAAEVLGIRAATVRSQTARGLANLRSALGEGVDFDETAERGAWTNANAGPGGRGDVGATAAAIHR